VVIIGQDPYHQPGQAHGLCFSVLPGVKVPPSLVNIYKELKRDLDIEPASHGYLESWAQQGVLLLNAVLTVEDSNANAHQGKGWEGFTDKVIQVVNEQCDNVVFMLWGGYAQKKGAIIDTKKHLVLKAPHPSPLSAHRGFLGCQHFSQANDYLSHYGKTTINWQLAE
jgi:uracil-DNA glycosylase